MTNQGEASAVPIESTEAYIARTLSAEEAAVRLHMSTQAVRKRLTKGVLKGKLVTGSKGKVWRVELDDAQAQLSNREHHDSVVADLVEMAKDANNRAKQATAEAAWLREENANLREKLAAQTVRLEFAEAKLSEASAVPTTPRRKRQVRRS